MSASYPPIKRLFDLTVASFALISLSPVLVACAAAVKASSAGPVIFRQERVGKDGRRFKLMKFRSMRVQNSGPQVTSATDPRITRVGKVLRSSKLDELPQLLNVIRGDMSLVGPRPEVPRYVEMFPDRYQRILRVRPGITDFAAIEYRNEERILAKSSNAEQTYIEEVLPDKLRLYEKYLAEMSFATDLTILFRTVGVVLK